MKSDLVGIRLLKNQKIRSEHNVVDPHDLEPTFCPNADPDPGSQTNADSCRSGSCQILKSQKAEFYSQINADPDPDPNQTRDLYE